MLLNGIESDDLVYHASGKMYVETTGISGYNPSPDESDQFGECMEDWHDYEWRKEQEEMDRRRAVEKWEKWAEENGKVNRF